MNSFGNLFLTSANRDWVIETCLSYSYDLRLVALAFAVALFTSYTAFHLVVRLHEASTNVARTAWLATGAGAMGGGIWSMHFISMLALELPASVRYDITLTVLSAVFAMIASGGAFRIVVAGGRNSARLIAGGAVLGAGIGAMHYTGMAAMQMDAEIRYDPLILAASVVVAVSLSILALRLLYFRLEAGSSVKRLRWVLGSCVMGLSVAAMHYTGMAATYFLPARHGNVIAGGIDASQMAVMVAVATMLFVALSLAASVFDQARRFRHLKAQLTEQSLSAVIDYVDEAIITIDRKGAIQSFNPAAERMFGYGHVDVIGEDVSILLLPGYRAEHVGFLENADLHAPRIIGNARALRGMRKGGETFDIQINISSMQAGGERMFIGVCRDITARKKMEAAMREAKESSDAANRAKSEFLANMSHELRTPLNAVIGFSEMIKNQTFGPVGSSRYREYATDINDAGQHLLDLINDILDLSKIESGKPELNEERFDIAEIADWVVHLLQEQAQIKRLNVVIEAPEFPLLLLADKRMVKQIIVNLFSNAIKFTEPGGSVTLKYWSQKDSGYVVQVTDTGIGMALEDIPKALAPFTQLDGDHARKHEGTGLGLPLAKSMVESHGGSLDLQSQAGIGTTVTVRFPAERVAGQDSSGRLQTA